MSPVKYCGQVTGTDGSETVCRMDVSPAQQAARDKIAAQLAAAGFALPGTLTDPRLRLRQTATAAATPTRPGCTAPTPNGPARSAARPSPAASPRPSSTAWQPLFDNAKKIRALLAELQDLTLEIIEASPDQNNDT